MEEMIQKIREADKMQIGTLVEEVMKRYRELYPEWEILYYSWEKAVDKNQQIDEVIACLERMKG